VPRRLDNKADKGALRLDFDRHTNHFCDVGAEGTCVAKRFDGGKRANQIISPAKHVDYPLRLIQNLNATAEAKAACG
jgi:hypothetical protein